jgi:hypothetical protein
MGQPKSWYGDRWLEVYDTRTGRFALIDRWLDALYEAFDLTHPEWLTS